MKKIFTLLMCTMGSLTAVDPSMFEKWHDESKPHFHDITTENLKRLLEKNQNVILVDARDRNADEGTRLPNAISLPYESSTTEIKRALPSKEATIVVYCASGNCPAAQNLVDQLLKLGYTHVYKYPAGLKGWLNAGYPLTFTN